MSLLRRLISRSYRRARRAEAGGRYRDAAALYAEAGCAEEAANALLFAAARATDPDERLAAYHDALRWLPADHPRRLDVDARIGQAVLESAQRDGVSSVEERQRLRDAAARLERAGRDLEAATAYELLGQVEDAARCLQNAGEVERLEALLDESTRAEQLERAVRARVAEYEMAMSVGARLEAKAALEAGLAAAPRDAALADLLRRLEARRPRDRRVTLRLAERELLVVGRPEVVLGREGDVALRGASVSRAHAAVEVVPGGLIVRDLGSRNGTLAHGVPIAGELRLTAEAEIGETYLGRVVKVVDFGAFVRILPNMDGLVHISELANRRVNKVEDVLREGDEVLVKVIGMDRGKVKLSRKAALTEEQAALEDAPTQG